MAFNLIDIPSQGGGWFKADHEKAGYAAFLIEVRDFERQRPGAYGPKDSALVDMTIFKTEQSLAKGEPDEVIVGIRVEQTILARDLAPLKGSATVVTLAQIPSSKPGQHPAWVWRQASSQVKNAVAAYGAAREAEIEAALSGAPSFDD